MLKADIRRVQSANELRRYDIREPEGLVRPIEGDTCFMRTQGINLENASIAVPSADPGGEVSKTSGGTTRFGIEARYRQ